MTAPGPALLPAPIRPRDVAEAGATGLRIRSSRVFLVGLEIADGLPRQVRMWDGRVVHDGEEG